MSEEWRCYGPINLNTAYDIPTLTLKCNGVESALTVPGPCSECGQRPARWYPMVVGSLLLSAELVCSGGHRWTVHSDYGAAVSPNP